MLYSNFTNAHTQLFSKSSKASMKAKRVKNCARHIFKEFNNLNTEYII